jgi:hemoglobin-like flavoprotein
MNPIRIALVQASWRRLKPEAATVAALFYGRLFELDPALRPLFRNDLVAQGTKLTTAIEFVVDGLAQLQPRLPVLQELARRHVRYGVQERDYDTVGAALLWTLRQGLGDDATDELIAGWAEAYGLIARTMKRAAWPDGASATEWAAQAA